ncbi:MAG: PQQ-binding-like beta-propeller repeat protein [Planctomycetes bacterium]|nr:PQQ-binding-like beta-propeller repeat protein [Planctomycetota bacterium]
MRNPILPWAFAAGCVLSCTGADWLQFRGNDGTGASTETGLPTAWDVKTNQHVAWRADLPGRGPSSPIVVQGKVIVTCSSGPRQDRLHVLCFDARTGERLWERQFWATGRTFCHPTSAIAAPTPASDGELIFAFYSSNDLACLDLDGNLQWYRGLGLDYPAAGNDVGMAASPVVMGGTVIVQVECLGESFATGLDKQTGETRWWHAREQAMNWTSPGVVRDPAGGNELVLLQSPSRISAHQPATGEEVWSLETRCEVISSPFTDGRLIFIPASGLTAVRRDAQGPSPEIIWQETKLSSGSCSPVVHQGLVYTLNNAGVLNCGNAQTGNVEWQLRLKGRFWANPVIAGGHLYAVNQDGLAFVVRLGDKGEIVSQPDFGEPIFGTPAAADGALFFRSDAHLWRISQ